MGCVPPRSRNRRGSARSGEGEGGTAQSSAAEPHGDKRPGDSVLVDMRVMLREASETAAKRSAVQPAPKAPVAPIATSPAALGLEQELAKAEGGRAWIRKLAVWAGVAILIGAGVVWRIKTRPPPQPKYVLSPVTQGDIVESVQSTGTVQPLTQVQVGAQISGRIAKVFVDFNSIVKKGDVLAEIDPTLLGATVEQNRAQAAAAEAQLGRTQAALATTQAALDRSSGFAPKTSPARPTSIKRAVSATSRSPRWPRRVRRSSRPKRSSRIRAPT